MASTKLTAVWTGVTGLPGYSHALYLGQLSGTQLTAAASSFRNFWFACRLYLPAGVLIQVSAVADYLGDDGQTSGHVNIPSPPGVVTSTGTGTWTGGSGAVVHWHTGLFLDGREVRGKTFVVPLNGAAYSVDGTIASTPLGDIQTAATAMIGVAGATLVVGSKRGGAWVTPPVTSAVVPDRSAFLRSRRQ